MSLNWILIFAYPWNVVKSANYRHKKTKREKQKLFNLILSRNCFIFIFRCRRFVSAAAAAVALSSVVVLRLLNAKDSTRILIKIVVIWLLCVTFLPTQTLAKWFSRAKSESIISVASFWGQNWLLLVVLLFSFCAEPRTWFSFSRLSSFSHSSSRHSFLSFFSSMCKKLPLSFSWAVMY